MDRTAVDTPTTVSAIERCLNALEAVLGSAGASEGAIESTWLSQAREELRRLNESDSLVEAWDEGNREEGLNATTRDMLLPSMVEEGYTQQENGRWTPPE